MSKPDVMMLVPQRRDAMHQLEERYHLHRWDQAQDRTAFLEQYGSRCRALISHGLQPIEQSLLDALPNLELIACSTAGFDAFDVPSIAARQIRLTNTSPALQDDVADTAIMLLLAARRGLVAADAHVRSGNWVTQGPFPLQRSLKNSKLGIVGMGTIGQAIAARAEAFQLDIHYWNRRQKPVPWRYQPDLLTLAEECDHLIVIVAGGEETRHLISESVLNALGPQGLLINVARGSVVDQSAMIRALQDGRLGHAALDVYAREPTDDPALINLPNVTLYPHHASGTVETRDAMAQLAVDNLEAFFAGKPLSSEVDLSPWRK